MKKRSVLHIIEEFIKSSLHLVRVPIVRKTVNQSRYKQAKQIRDAWLNAKAARTQ